VTKLVKFFSDECILFLYWTSEKTAPALSGKPRARAAGNSCFGREKGTGKSPRFVKKILEIPVFYNAELYHT